jgi:two-component sensor histidine kinase
MTTDRALFRASWQSWIGGRLDRVGPYWMQWLWTLLFSAAIAVGFTVLGFVIYAHDAEGGWLSVSGWLFWYGKNLVVSLTIGAAIHLAFDALRPLVGGRAGLRRWKPWQRTVFFSGVPLACVFFAWPLGLWLAGMPVQLWTSKPQSGNLITAMVMLALLLTFIFHHFFATKARQHEAEKRAAEAQLRLLQGQIEPHFLFNTLAGVLSLIDHDPAKAKQMLGDFTEYLRASLGAMRSELSPLAQELELAENYLRLLGARMDERLHWQIDADDDARRVNIPPLLLQPLVENAIHHGLEPKVEGGRVHVSAHLQGRALVLQVQDDGRGPEAAARPGARKGNGVALKNIRERLLSHYGHNASLEVSAAHPGTLAVLRLPLGAASARTDKP